MENKHLEYTLGYFNIPNKQIDIDKVKNVYFYGSHNYGTDNENSDMDYIIVYDQDIDVSNTLYTKMHDHELNATLISPKHFQKMIDEQRIDALECLFTIEDWKYETINYDFVLDLEQLRRSISAVSSNSFVKCKKKLEQNDDYIGKKSLFHSLRIVDFGIQIANEGKIVSFKKPYSKNLSYETYSQLLNEIMSYNTWEELKNKYQNIANKLRTEFRIITTLKK